MDKDRARKLVRDTFQHGFQHDRFRTFLTELLNRYEPKPLRYVGAYIPDAFKDQVSSLERIGTYQAPGGERIDLLIVQLTRKSTLARARTALRNYVAHHLKTRDAKDAALVAFVSPTEETWRFSFVRMEYATVTDARGRIGTKTELTPARRMSYLVGEGESSHTAQSRFLDILQQTTHDPAIEELEGAFSVETVTKEFFEQYEALFLTLKQQLDEIAARDKVVGREFVTRKIDTVDFAKKLMGQIVFLYFLQKKGWLGVAKGEQWGAGPHDFIRRLARGDFGVRGNIFNDILEPLFYDTLAVDRGQEAWCSRFQCRIPFLNGGLFEPIGGYDWSATDIVIPDSFFTNQETTASGDRGTGILDVFDRYNFTVNEAEPLEIEVAIDPEMLGKVFEKLLEVRERKSKGSFYTPREIVHYMCEESLINYLDGRLNQSGTVVDRADIEALIRAGEQAAHYEAARKDGTVSYSRRLPASVEKQARAIDKALSAITVCDPAIGSGAFPVGMMTEIVRARTTLTPYFNDARERTPYFFKRHAIQASLYGVDIDPGAIEIAKLRLWLSLVVDEEDVQQIKPLPNLDYKVVAGNSLLGFPFKSARVDKIERLKAEFFDETDHATKLRLKDEIDSELAQAFASSRRSLGYEVTFDFEIYFSEVFRAHGGFDVVIANPPYVSVEKFARTELQRAWKQRFTTYAGRGDIYCFFYEQGFSLLRDGGILTFISSNKFQRAAYGRALRELLASRYLHALIDFCELPVFAASTDPMIVIAEKTVATQSREFPVLVVKDESEFSSLAKSVGTRASPYRPEQLKADGWSLEGAGGLLLIGRLRSMGTPLVDFVSGEYYYGIKTGLNAAFVIDRTTRERLIREDHKSADLIKPWIRGKDIKRWKHEFHELYVIVFPHGFHVHLNRYPAVKRHLETFEKKLRARGQCQTSRNGAEEGQHHWLELDNNPSSEFLSLFERDRVVLPIIKKSHGFAFVEGGSCSNDKTTFFVSAEPHFLLAVLNSSTIEWIVRMEFPGHGDPWAGGRIEYRAGKVKGLPIPSATAADKAKLARLAQAAAAAVEHDDAGVAQIEHQINEVVYRLFKVTAEESAQIESALATTRAQVSADEDDE
jgi:type I restriction-modification system DNA methylase subunit